MARSWPTRALTVRSYRAAAIQSARIAAARLPDRSRASASRSRAARVPEISRRCLGHTDLRGRRTGCVHGLARRSGEIVNQRPQLRVGRIEHEPRADGVECLLWSSGRQLTTRGGAKGHELLLVCARPLGDAAGWRGLW